MDLTKVATTMETVKKESRVLDVDWNSQGQIREIRWAKAMSSLLTGLPKTKYTALW